MNPSVTALLIICVLVLYAYRNHNHEFEASASAIREIWSGSCRLSCRQSEYNSFSGLRGLDRLNKDGSNCFLTNQTQPGRSDCICETCPCKLIDNVLRTCRPATNLYSQFIEMISNGYYNAVKALSDAYKFESRVSECGMSIQRAGQLIPIKLVGSADNINFVNNIAVKAENIKIKAANRKTIQEDGKDEKRELPSTSGKEFAYQKDVTKEFRKNGAVSEKVSVTDKEYGKDKDSLKYDISASESSKEIVSDKKRCSKCIEKGKICIGSCPNTYENKNKDKKK